MSFRTNDLEKNKYWLYVLTYAYLSGNIHVKITPDTYTRVLVIQARKSFLYPIYRISV